MIFLIKIIKLLPLEISNNNILIGYNWGLLKYFRGKKYLKTTIIILNEW